MANKIDGVTEILGDVKVSLWIKNNPDKQVVDIKPIERKRATLYAIFWTDNAP